MQPEDSFLQHVKPIRLQRSAASMTQLVGTRPLSSADESGPVTKKLRSTSMRQRTLEAIKSSSSLPLVTDDPLKKARARPALTLANIFSSSGRRSQSAATSSRSNNKPNRDPPPNPGLLTRRSSRLLSGSSHKPSKVKWHVWNT
jgi:anaphase-promoting complex subunit 3